MLAAVVWLWHYNSSILKFGVYCANRSQPKEMYNCHKMEVFMFSGNWRKEKNFTKKMNAEKNSCGNSWRTLRTSVNLFDWVTVTACLFVNQLSRFSAMVNIEQNWGFRVIVYISLQENFFCQTKTRCWRYPSFQLLHLHRLQCFHYSIPRNYPLFQAVTKQRWIYQKFRQWKSHRLDQKIYIMLQSFLC